MVLWLGTGDAAIGVMDTSGPSCGVGRLLDLLFSILFFIALGAIFLGVVTENLGTLCAIGKLLGIVPE